jgi:hypothetical protein
MARWTMKHSSPMLIPAYHVADLDNESAAIWLADVPVRRVRWDVGRHRHAAHLLGRLAASPTVAPFAAQVPVGRPVRGFAEYWLAINVIPDLTTDDLWRQPNVAATFDPPLRRRILRAAAALPALVDELESLPVATAHGDACTDNLLLTTATDDLVLMRVAAASPEHLLAMKVLAARRRDAEDIRFSARRTTTSGGWRPGRPDRDLVLVGTDGGHSSGGR